MFECVFDVCLRLCNVHESIRACIYTFKSRTYIKNIRITYGKPEIYIFTYMIINIYTYMYIYIYLYIHIHTYIHI